MTPKVFPEANKALSKPDGMTEECHTLYVWTNEHICISQWQGTWSDRLRFLLTGKVWLHVVFGATQPPVYVGSESPFKLSAWDALFNKARSLWRSDPQS